MKMPAGLQNFMSGVFILAGIFSAGGLNFFLVEPFVIANISLFYFADPQPGWLLNLFYDFFVSVEGIYVLPSLFNVYFTAISGGIAGYLAWRAFKKLRDARMGLRRNNAESNWY